MLLALYAVIFLSDARLLFTGPEQLNHGHNLWFGCYYIALPGLAALAVNCGPWPVFMRWSFGLFLSAQLGFGQFLGMWLVTPSRILNNFHLSSFITYILAVVFGGLAYSKIWPWVIIPPIVHRSKNNSQHSVGQLMLVTSMISILATQFTLLNRQDQGVGPSSETWQRLVIATAAILVAHVVAFLPAVWLAAIFVLGNPSNSSRAFQFLSIFAGLQALAFIAGPVIVGYNQLIAIESLVCGLGFYAMLAFVLSIARLLGFQIARKVPNTPAPPIDTIRLASRLSPNLRFALAISLIAIVFAATLGPAREIHKKRVELREQLYEMSP